MKRTKLQSKCVSQLTSAFRRGQRAALLQLPTGQGKSLIAAAVYVTSARTKGMKLLLVTPSAKPLSAGWIRALSLDVDSKAAKRPQISFYFKKSGAHSPNACRITMGQLTRFFREKRKKHPKLLWQQWLIERRAFVVIDEFHRSSSLRRELAQIFEQGRAAPRLRLGPMWLLLSATPYNPVELDFAVDRVNSPPTEEQTIAREIGALGREVKMTLFALAALEGIRDELTRKEIYHREASIRAALSESSHDETVIWSRGPLTIVPATTSELKPTKSRNNVDAPESESIREDLRLVATFHGRQKQRGPARRSSTFAERLVFAGARPSSQTELNRHPYGSTTVDGVKLGLPSRNTRLAAQEALIEIVRASLKVNDKVLVFCSHRAAVASAVHLLISRLGLSRKDVVGSAAAVVPSALAGNVQAFHSRSDGPQVLITSDVNSESVDLHGHCRTLVHYELPWTPLRVMQRYGRLWRLNANGKQRTPRVFHIVHPGGVGEEILNRLRRRWRYLKILGIDYVDNETALGTRAPRVPW